MAEAFYALIGLIIGAAAGAGIVLLRRRQRVRLAQELLEEADRKKADELAAIVEQVKTRFAALSREALSANADDFLKLAKGQLEQQTALGSQNLETKRKLIDARLEEMGKKLGDLSNALQTIEKERRESHGAIVTGLDRATKVTQRLSDTTGQLREALANPQRRGQWGERMAEDVLRLAGFIEGVNYHKQQQATGGGKPDFTFPLPESRCVHMDVKFPLVNYMKVLDAADETARSSSAALFIKDVRARIKEVTTRDYIDPAGGTVDYVIVFIPNEQIYGFIHEHDNALLDDALRAKVVLCSPLTLYAMLAIIRQSVESHRLEQASVRILDLLADFKKQWDLFVGKMDSVGDRLEAASKAYDDLKGVRTRQLERQLDKIDDFRASRAELTGPDSSPTRGDAT